MDIDDFNARPTCEDDQHHSYWDLNDGPYDPTRERSVSQGIGSNNDSVIDDGDDSPMNAATGNVGGYEDNGIVASDVSNTEPGVHEVVEDDPLIDTGTENVGGDNALIDTGTGNVGAEDVPIDTGNVGGDVPPILAGFCHNCIRTQIGSPHELNLRIVQSTSIREVPSRL